MKNNSPLLTIAIPTYNRIKKLKISLPIILSQAYDLDTEIFISDNASTDRTRAYIRELQNKYPKLGYYRNEQNLGLDGNFLNCFNKAKGHYLWMLSDDDFLTENTIDKIMEILKKNPVFVYLNTRMKGVKYSHYPDIGEIYYSDKNEFLREVGLLITFTTAMIYKTDFVKQVANKDKFKGEELLLSHVAIETLKNEGKYIIITKDCAECSPNYSLSYDFCRTFIYGWHKLLFTTGIKSGFNSDMLNILLHHSLRTTIFEMLISYRKTDPNAKKWDKSLAWEVINKYPDLIPLYKIALEMPTEEIENYRKEIENLQKETAEILEIINIAKKYNKIYLYGAGVRAKIIYDALISENINIAGIIISDGQEKKEFHNLPIYYLSEFNVSPNDYGIIITLKYNDYLPWEIYDALRKKGYDKNTHLQRVLYTC